MIGTARSLVPWIDRRIKYQQQESFTWTSPTTPQFNLTKIDHNRLIVRCLLRTINYENQSSTIQLISMKSLVRISSSDDVTTTSPSPQHRNLIGCSIAKVSWWPTSDCYRRTLEMHFNRRYNYGKRRLKTSDSQLSQSQFNNILYIKLRQTISIE